MTASDKMYVYVCAWVMKKSNGEVCEVAGKESFLVATPRGMMNIVIWAPA